VGGVGGGFLGGSAGFFWGVGGWCCLGGGLRCEGPFLNSFVFLPNVFFIFGCISHPHSFSSAVPVSVSFWSFLSAGITASVSAPPFVELFGARPCLLAVVDLSTSLLPRILIF